MLSPSLPIQIERVTTVNSPNSQGKNEMRCRMPRIGHVEPQRREKSLGTRRASILVLWETTYWLQWKGERGPENVLDTDTDARESAPILSMVKRAFADSPTDPIPTQSQPPFGAVHLGVADVP